MSTLKLENIKHENSSTNNMVMNSDGSVSTTGTLNVNSRLQVGDASITQQYPALGYVADFQASSGSQTFISIAEPGASSLGNNGVVFGEDTTNTYLTQRGNKPINFGTSDINRLVIDGSGRVKMPYQPSFMVRGNSGNQSIASGGAVASGFHNATVMHNVGNHLNSTNAIFTAPVDGRYYMEVSIYAQTSGGATSQYVAAYLNFSNAGPIYGFTTPGPDVQAQISGIVNMSANDTVQPYTYGHPSLTQTYLGQHSYFSGHLLG